MIAVLDYGVGNLGSIKNMLDRIGTESVVTSDPSVIAAAQKLILPGVGAFDHGIRRLRDSGLVPLLEDKVRKERVTILGICLGMQLLTSKSEEGGEPGLAWIEGETVRFHFEEDQREGSRPLPIPHMGWNTATVVESACPLFEGLGTAPRFYFVHSYYVRLLDSRQAVARTLYGTEFTSALQKDNIFGVQFHPEKSHQFGIRLLTNFAKL